jgi:hypothetical protein
MQARARGGGGPPTAEAITIEFIGSHRRVKSGVHNDSDGKGYSLDTGA